MKLSGNIIKSLLTLLACTTLTVGCIKDNFPIEYPETLTLQMSMGTKAAVSETDGTPSSSELEIYTLRIYAFVNGEDIGHTFISNADGSALTDNQMTFYMDLKVYESYMVEGVSTNLIPIDFYVIANENAVLSGGNPLGLNGSEMESSLNSMFFTALNEGKGLPMYAVQRENIQMMGNDATTSPTDDNHKDHTLINHKVELHLQRPFGKLGVFAAKVEGENEDLKITGLRLLENGTVLRNHIMPQSNLNEALRDTDFGVGGVNLNPEGLEVQVTSEIATEASEDFRRNPANYTPVQSQAYYPYENPYGSEPANWATQSDTRGNVLEIDYQFGNKTPETGTVYLPPIKRNEYCIVNCLFNNSGKLTIEYVVVEWEEVKWDDLVFEHPDYNSLSPVGGGTVPYPQAVCWYTGQDSYAGAFKAQFSMHSPANLTWVPTLMNATKREYNISVFEQKDKAFEFPLLPEQLVASEEPYVIVIQPLMPTSADRTFDFAISYTPVWDLSDTQLMFINGNPGNLSYSNSGSDHRYLRITQLASAPTTN